MVTRWTRLLGERLGSGDGERKTLLTRQIAFEPLPASVLFAHVRSWWFLMATDQASEPMSKRSPRQSPLAELGCEMLAG